MSKSSEPRETVDIVTLSGMHGQGWTDPVAEAAESVKATMEKAGVVNYFVTFETREGRVMVGAKGNHPDVIRIVQEAFDGLAINALRAAESQRAAVRQTKRNDPSGS